ncbi:hypothetical protein [Bosea sp. (in: a-proteobacteria)]|uniref:DUF6925 family protein n=1 Tax=Bosea sp. (in: a-proteobacteria) TaxID=1871050 RepID=UPI002627B418|nr:hypothetical protein [Bosea sp. (in: a-proteobacteria)]MCO5091347.1 hypothetical protein [Bosea sp. (in: a-proteobacteria)]
MTDSEAIRAVLRAHLLDETSQWNLGTFGAIAEFMRDPGEPVAIVDEPGRLAATTARGGIGFGGLDGVRLFASETAIGTIWSHRVALCLPEEACAMSRRTVLTDLGPDSEALRAADAGAILFDMGLGTLQADICIRTADPALIGLLRAQAGRSLFEPGNQAMPAIVAAGPHRVFIARIGRCEVYQPIPPADGRSPEGPHTHVLPQLLRAGRTHAATEPVPAGHVPCAHLVPVHPLRDAMGQPRPFDRDAFDRFADLLDRFGDPGLVATKRAVRNLLASDAAPEAFSPPPSRFGRNTVKVALRQQKERDGPTGRLRDWLRCHDPRDGQGPGDGGADDYGHG